MSSECGTNPTTNYLPPRVDYVAEQPEAAHRSTITVGGLRIFAAEEALLHAGTSYDDQPSEQPSQVSETEGEKGSLQEGQVMKGKGCTLQVYLTACG